MQNATSRSLSTPEPILTEAQVRQYEEDGVICLRGFFSAWIEPLRAATERVLAQPTMIDFNAAGQTGKFAGDINVWTKDDTFKAFAIESPCWQIAKELMRSNKVSLFGDQLFVKEPGTSTPSPWHHDQTYWPVTGKDICSIWVPMDRVTKETSGLEYVRGSHRWGRRFDPADFGGQSLEMFRDAANDKIPDIDAHREDYEILSWELEPGDCLVHQGLAVHGAGGNLSQKQRRRAISVRWFGDDTRYKQLGPFSPEYVGMAAGASITEANTAMWPVVPLTK